MLIVVARCQLLPCSINGGEHGVNVAHFVLAWGKPDDDSPPVIGVAFAAHEAGLLQAVEHASDRPGGQAGKVGKLTGGHQTGAFQQIDDLQIGDGHPNPRGGGAQEGRAARVKLPEFARKRSEDLLAVFLSTPCHVLSLHLCCICLGY